MNAKLPIVYSSRYNITLLGIERLHPFDSAKYGKVFSFLRQNGILDGRNHHRPRPVTRQTLLEVHTPEYLDHLRSSRAVARIAEVSPLRFLPNFLLQWRFLKPMRFATGGTILAAGLAREHGWAINLSGGYHHAKSDFSSGFCFYADISLAAYHHLAQFPDHKVMVVDLDAHQGNGFESIHRDDPRLPAFDMYNGGIYPFDLPARKFITYNHPLPSGISDVAYLSLLQKELPLALDREKPDMIIYNAGTDIYEKDRLGAMQVSAAGILVRDETVFREAKNRGIPVLMVLSGGYTPESAGIIGSSIRNLWKKKIIE
jgi:histone deacetylase 11